MQFHAPSTTLSINNISVLAVGRQRRHRPGAGALLGLEREREREVIGLFLITAVLLAGVLAKSCLSRYLRKLPRNVVFGAEPLAALLQRRKVARRHHARPVARRPRL